MTKKIAETIQVKDGKVIVPQEDSMELLGHLGEPHGHPGLAGRLRRIIIRLSEKEPKE